MKNFKFFSVITMLAGMFTTTGVQAQSCDTLRNYNPTDQFYNYSTSSGLFLGHTENTQGSDILEIDVWAEPYNVGTATEDIRAVQLAPWKAQNNSNNATLTINVYTDAGGEPGTVMGSESVSYDDITVDAMNLIEFTNPVSVTGSFYVGYELDYTSPVDSFALIGTEPVSNDYTILHLTGSGPYADTWQDASALYTANSAFVFEVLIGTGTAPTADFTIDTEACVSGSFAVDGSASTGTTDSYEWYLTDNPPDLQNPYDESTGATTSLSPTTAGTGQRIYMAVYGACTLDAIYGIVDVYPDVTATVNVTNETCGDGNAEIDITGVTGGGGNELYSIDGGTNTQSGSTFSNLSADTYDVVVTGNGSGCEYTETVTVTNSSEPITVGSDETICGGTSVSLTASGNGTIEWFANGSPVGNGTSISVSPTTNTTYDAVLTDANGCTDTKQVTVSVNPQDDATFTYTSNTICTGGPNVTPSINTTGGTFTIATSGLVFADASTGEIDVASSTNGTYDVTYATTGTCSNSETQSITITNAPDASFSYANASYCQSASAATPTFPTGASAGTFTAGNGLAISAGTGAIDFAASTANSYTVTNTIAASGTCSMATETFSITIDASPSVIAGTNQSVCEGTSVTLSGSGADTYSWNNSISDATAFTPNVGSLTYTVTGTASNGCTATDDVIVAVTASPTVDAGTNQAVCEGSDVTLTANASNGTVTWGNNVMNGIPFAPTTTITYTVTANDNGCLATDDVMITVNPNPTVTVGQDQTVCVDDNAIQLSGGDPAGGIYIGAGVTNGEFDPADAGEDTHSITYAYSDGNGCENSATFDITVDGCASLDKNDINTITVAPNPASDYIEVKGNENTTVESIYFVSTQGKTIPVNYSSIDAETMRIDVQTVSTGTYFIQVVTNNGLSVKKIVVQ